MSQKAWQRHTSASRVEDAVDFAKEFRELVQRVIVAKLKDERARMAMFTSERDREQESKRGRERERERERERKRERERAGDLCVCPYRNHTGSSRFEILDVRCGNIGLPGGPRQVLCHDANHCEHKDPVGMVGGWRDV